MIGEIYTVAIQGTHCGAPFSVSLAYEQLQATANNGLDLVSAFWEPGLDSPGGRWLSLSSNKLKAVCMSWSSPTDVGAALLEGRQGEIATLTMPPVCAVLYHLRPITPHNGGNVSKPKYDIGRFFLPGLVHSQVDRFALTQAAINSYKTLGESIRELEINNVVTFRLVAFPKFIAPQNGDSGVRSCFPDSIIRRIPTRKPNLCELYAGTGQEGGRPVIGV